MQLICLHWYIQDTLDDVARTARFYIQEIEQAVLDGEFLEEAYTFRPELADSEPHFTPEEVAYARGGNFIMF